MTSSSNINNMDISLMNEDELPLPTDPEVPEVLAPPATNNNPRPIIHDGTLPQPVGPPPRTNSKVVGSSNDKNDSIVELGIPTNVDQEVAGVVQQPWPSKKRICLTFLCVTVVFQLCLGVFMALNPELVTLALLPEEDAYRYLWEEMLPMKLHYDANPDNFDQVAFKKHLQEKLKSDYNIDYDDEDFQSSRKILV